jgi:hypothetical protein
MISYFFVSVGYICSKHRAYYEEQMRRQNQQPVIITLDGWYNIWDCVSKAPSIVSALWYSFIQRFNQLCCFSEYRTNAFWKIVAYRCESIQMWRSLFLLQITKCKEQINCHDVDLSNSPPVRLSPNLIAVSKNRSFLYFLEWYQEKRDTSYATYKRRWEFIGTECRK